MNEIPIIDLSRVAENREKCVWQVGHACRESGFFYLVGHGVDSDLIAKLERLSRQFFASKLEEKMQLAMAKAGIAWRGYFPVGAELTSGKPDVKEGLYFGSELDHSDPRVASQTPLHGANLFPSISGFRETVLEYIDRLTELGHRLLELIAGDLELSPDHFSSGLTRDPLILFRIFHYPPLHSSRSSDAWSVGEHTDYGLLTLLHQDTSGGLQVKSRDQWIDAVPISGAYICNIGDMLERITGGLYRSTPHRVRNPGITGRISFPFFFDPSFDARVEPIRSPAISRVAAADRWDKKSVHDFTGTYGEYVSAKVAQVFPELFHQHRR